MKYKIRAVSALVIFLLACVTAVLTIPATSWRVKVLRMKQRGDLTDVGWTQLLSMLRPGSPYRLQPLLSTKNLYLTVQNPFNSPRDVKAGAELFARKCSACHGPDGAGGKVRSLIEGPLRTGVSDWAIYRAITVGVPGTAMAAQSLSEQEAWSLVAFLQVRRQKTGRSTNGDDVGSAKAFVEAEPVSFDDLVQPTPEDWLTYSGGYNGQRFSRLRQINRSNVGRLTVEWVFQSPSGQPTVETTPLIRNGVMFLSGPQNEVWALDAANGSLFWSYRRVLPRHLSLCCGMVNRGVALLGDRVYLGTLDAHLVALEAASGSVIWDVQVADPTAGYSITGAPLALNDKVVTGIAGGEFGIRGFIAAYDARSGKQRWRFNTIPEPGEPGHATWGGPAWKTGGAPTWLTGSYDAELNLIYWGVGNPAPDHDGRVRPGDNLYSNSVVALDGETGRLKWHFQFTPHDERDWDAVQIPVLADANEAPNSPKRMLWANRNGFFYVLNRETGRFLQAQPFVPQNWAASIDSAGRPILRPEAVPSEGGSLSYPGSIGATNWWPPAFHPVLNLFYVPALESGSVIYRIAEEFRPGNIYMGGAAPPVKTAPFQYSIRALDGRTGTKVWEYRPPPRKGVAERMGGLLATAGSVVFGADDTSFFALDAETGKELWKFNTGGVIAAAPVTYAVAGKQYISIASGRTLFTFALPD